MTAPHTPCSVFLIKKIIVGGVKVDNIVTVGGHINASINFAMQQNYVPVIRSLVVNNNSEEVLENISLKITFEPEFAKEFTYHIGSIPAKSSAEISPVRISTNTDLLFSLTEKMVGNITIEVLQNGENIFTYQNTIELLACDQWSGLNIMPEMIAAFVTPNHPALSPVIHDASTFLKKWKGDPSFTGYQTNNPNNVKLQMAAIFAALVQQKIVYNDPPASYEVIGQRIRLPHKVLEQKMGTCLDLAVLYAACLEAVGLHPLLFFMTGHAFCGCWLENETFADCCVDDVSAIEKRIAENAEEMLLVECTDFVDSNVHNVERFDHAMKHGKDHISNMEFQCVIDIIRTRGSGIRPIPLRPEQTYSGLQLAEGSDKPKEMLAPSELNSSLLGKVAEGNDKPVTKMRIWERKLLDFSLRNSLLNFRVTKNTMQLMTADLGKLEDELASGSDFRIMEIPTEWTVSTRDAKIFAIENEKDLVTNIAENEFKNNRIRTFLNEADLDAALKSLYRSAKVSMEENGSNTLFLALGLLRWYESDLSEKPRYAPLVLIPIDIVRNTRNKGYIIRSRQEETQINVTLLEYLRQDHGISITGLDPLPLDEHGIDLPLVFNTIRQAVMGKKRWNIEEYAFIGLFSFSQFVMWNDLRNRSEEISQNKVVSSLMAGSLTYAPEDISITPENIDSDLDLENMAVPMSADSSQLAAIAAAGSGQSFVLHGPPGTGKTTFLQTVIANRLAHNILNNPEEPEIIVASSANNQAITNILKDFKAETTNDTAHPRLSNRWLPELDTLGLYLSGKKELQEQYKMMFNPMGDGFPATYDTPEHQEEYKNFYLQCFNNFFGKAYQDETKCQQFLRKEMQALQKKIIFCIQAAETTEYGNRKENNILQKFIRKFHEPLPSYDKVIEQWALTEEFKERYEKISSNPEYGNLPYTEDMAVRLDISYRYQMFWYAIHYREAEFIHRLSKCDEGKQRTQEAYTQRLKRLACVMPVFISTFHSLPKYMTYAENGKWDVPLYNGIDLLIVDESGQVSPELAVPSFRNGPYGFYLLNIAY